MFNGEACKSPAPISSLVANVGTGFARTTAPAEVSGFCSQTDAGQITAGSVTISVHVASCKLTLKEPYEDSTSNAHTGTPTDFGYSTSAIVVEEYC